MIHKIHKIQPECTAARNDNLVTLLALLGWVGRCCVRQIHFHDLMADPPLPPPPPNLRRAVSRHGRFEHPGSEERCIRGGCGQGELNGAVLPQYSTVLFCSWAVLYCFILSAVVVAAFANTHTHTPPPPRAPGKPSRKRFQLNSCPAGPARPPARPCHFAMTLCRSRTR